MKRVAHYIGRKSIPLSLFLILVGLWSLSQIPSIKVDNGIEVWLDHHSPEYLLYQQFQDDYGGDEWIVVAFSINEKDSKGLYDKVRSLTKALSQIDERIQVISITNADPWTRSRLSHILLSRDRQVVGILLNLAHMGTIEDRQGLVGTVKSALHPFEAEHVFHLGGPPVLNAELDRISEQQSRLFITLAAVAGLIVLFILFRSVLYVANLITAAGLAVGWTMGTAAGCGMTLNMISTVLPVLLWVLALTGGIHILFHFRKSYETGMTAEEAVERALQSVLVPYAIASFTTAIGFLSLLFSHMEPVRNLGMWSAFGIAIGFVSNIIIIPAILLLEVRLPFFQKRLRSKQPHMPHISPGLLHKQSKFISLAGFAALLIPLFFLPFLRAESNVLSFFKDDSPIIQDYSFISSHLSGLSTVELDFKGDPDELPKYVSELRKTLAKIEGIRPVQFATGDSIRMSIYVQEMDSLAFNALVKKIKGLTDEIIPDQLHSRLTGTIVLLNSIQEELVRTQIKSFALALIVIVAILALIFRSLPMVLIGTAVNLFPVMILAGTAAVTGIPLNVATIMVASIAIAIAVDDTVFFLARLRHEVNIGQDGNGAIDRTFKQMIGPISATTLVVAIGFLILTFADFKPVAYFGLLGGLTMILAWIGDMILLPALLYWFHPYSRQ